MARRDSVETEIATSQGPASGGVPEGADVQRFGLNVLEGPDAGASWVSCSERTAIGSHPSNDLVLQDRTVSRFHCEILLGPSGPTAVDLDSRNGTLVDGVRVKEAWLRDGSTLRIGHSVLSFGIGRERVALELHPGTQLGTMVGRSIAIRITFARMLRAAQSEGTVLLEGETGTGKEEAALSIHEASARRAGPFVVVDCGAIPGTLLESELFGHEKGAFTGASVRREGAFVAAARGSIFLDEVGELPAELQPKLLRALERRTVRPLGSPHQLPVDVRIIAATNRSLRAEVNAGRFRPDLYFRLAVLHIPIPPLRERPDDIPLLVEHLLEKLGAGPEAHLRIMTPEHIARLQRAAWPGNVRELRNSLERALAFEVHDLDADVPASPAGSVPPYLNPRMSLVEARRLAIEDFERRYLERLLALHDGNVSRAARAVAVSRAYLHRLLRRHGFTGA
jgi:two-component system, NtrC family, response regulator GlrR